jgi:hypothetical protein
MTAPARTPRARPVRKREAAPQHLHLPSVHVRAENGTGFDYDEDLYVRGQQVERIIRFVAIEYGAPTLIRETRDVLCPEELASFEELLPILMQEGNPAAQEAMEERARWEFARQLRISHGLEHACAKCGCSESKSCSGGCCWFSETICSRCA